MSLDLTRTEQFIEAIQEAQRRGMVPLVVVLPMSPEVLARPDAQELAARAIDKAARNIVKNWRREHDYE